MTTIPVVLLSLCCDADVVMGGRTTHYFTCVRCGKSCDVYHAEKGVERPARNKMVGRGKEGARWKEKKL